VADPLIPRPSALAALSLSFVLAGVAGGVAFDPTPPRPPAHRAGYRVLEADFHAHTTFSDGSLTPMGLVRQAERRGLDVIAVTEHNTAIPGLIAQAWQRLAGGPIVLVGEEVTTSGFHIIAVGISGTVSPHPDARAAIEEIHARDGLAIAAHPVSRFWPALVPVRRLLDGAEVMHPLALRGAGGGWRWAEAVTYFEDPDLSARVGAVEIPRAGPPKPLTAIGSSDYHWGSILGLCRTLLFVEDGAADEAGVRRALTAGRTVVIGRDGRLFGQPDLVSALEREPYTPRSIDYAYRGEGALDRVLRALGWLGLVGLVVLGWRPRPPKRDAAGGDR
jgi:hypothetical protein